MVHLRFFTFLIQQNPVLQLVLFIAPENKLTHEKASMVVENTQVPC